MSCEYLLDRISCPYWGTAPIEAMTDDESGGDSTGSGDQREKSVGMKTGPWRCVSGLSGPPDASASTPDISGVKIPSRKASTSLILEGSAAAGSCGFGWKGNPGPANHGVRPSVR